MCLLMARLLGARLQRSHPLLLLRSSSSPASIRAPICKIPEECKEELLKCKQEIKSDIYKELSCGQEQVALQHLLCLLELKNVITDWDCHVILGSCSVYNSAKVAAKLWNFMEETKMKPNAFSVAYLLGALSRGGCLDEAIKLLQRLGNDMGGVEENAIFCNVFLNGCSYATSVAHAEQCLHLMTEKGIKKDEWTYLEIIKLAGKKEDLIAIKRAWTEVSKICTPSLASYHTLVVSLLKAGGSAEAVLAFREMLFQLSKKQDLTELPGERKESVKAKFFEAARRIYPLCSQDDMKADEIVSLRKRISIKQSEEANQSLSGSAEHNSLLQSSDCKVYETPNVCRSMGLALLKQTPKYNHYLLYTFNAMINEAVKRKDYWTAEQLSRQIHAVGLKPSIHTYNAVLRAVVRGRGLQQGFQIVRVLESDGLKPNTHTYNAIMEGFCMKNELDKAETLLERMLEGKTRQQPSSFTFNILINACAAVDDLRRAVRVFAKMKLMDVKPDSCTFLALISAFGRVNAPYEKGSEDSQKELLRRLLAIEKYMAHADVQHTCKTFTAVLDALGAEGMMKVVIQRLRYAEGRVDKSGLPILNTVSYNAALHACVQAKARDTAKDVFERMKSLGFKPDIWTYNIMINMCCGSPKLDEAFQLWQKLQEDGLKADLWSYNTLSKVICHAGELDAALALLEEMQNGGIQPNRITFNTLLASAAYHERLDVTEFLLEHMRRENIQPDIVTCAYAVQAYLSHNQIDNAVEALRVLSIQMLSSDKAVQRQMEDVLKQIFSEDSSKVEESTLQLFEDAVTFEGLVPQSLLAVRMSGFGDAAADSWQAEKTMWAKRLFRQYERKYMLD